MCDESQRVESALIEVGTTTFSGIFLTKFIGVLVLSFAHSRATRIYFFRTFFGFVVFGGLHALIALPAVLLIFGDQFRPASNEPLVTKVMHYEELLEENRQLKAALANLELAQSAPDYKAAPSRLSGQAAEL